jgi:hypothetical protein
MGLYRIYDWMILRTGGLQSSVMNNHAGPKRSLGGLMESWRRIIYGLWILSVLRAFSPKYTSAARGE